ncbi:MAG TPA: transglutaminaseTgpA domain-containing protein [Acidimicrobiales bacterium]|nr:transglutaminaseTgpA domain-containing protein [Acidimicrobiales bacterium]
MTATLTPPVPDIEVPALQPEATASPPAERRAPAGLTCWAAALSTMAFAWLAASVFEGWFARAVGLVATGVGVGSVYLSTRARRPSVVQYGGALVTLVLGSALAVTFSGEDTGLLGLVGEALRGGGLSQPPLAFDPGWRFILFVTVALLGAACAALALSFDKPRSAALLTLPFVVGGALLQPPESEIGATVLALLLLVGSLAISMGADLASQGASSGAFEIRRLARGAAALGLLGAAVFATAQIGFLFPPPAAASVVPPMRPPAPPPPVDRVLFTVSADRQLPWRLGTLDVYDKTAWLTPPFDASALIAVDGEIPPNLEGDTRGPLPGPGVSAHVELADLEGKTLPSLANPLAVRGAAEVTFEPRTQMLRVAGVSPPAGTSYEVSAPAPPTGEALSAAPPPGPHALPFLEVPPPPAEITALLAEAPLESFARLQFVRGEYFANVVAAGAGNPVDVPPRRVVEMLAGKEASPYEITAGEVLLARWAGVPARLGYGWFGGEEKAPGTWEIRPKHGATWLEAYFEGSGWVPIVGTPPRAKPSTASGQRNEDPSVRPTDELALLVYVPIELSSVRLAYVLARHYLLASLPWLAGGGLALAFYPAFVRALRRTARRRAAARIGYRARIAAAYAELRDLVTDLNIASPGISPLELVERVEPDDEHRELAWLVTRSLWGDLQRDIQSTDVEGAETMSRSVARRLRSAQPALSRLAAVTSRASLKNPWTEELPTFWRPARARRTVRLAGLAVGAAALGGALILSWPSDPARSASVPLSDPAAPEAVDDIRFVREAEAETSFRDSAARPIAVEGRVFSLRQGDIVQGSLQVVRLDPRFDTRSPRVRDQVLSALGDARLRPARIGEERIFRLEQAEQTLMLAFGPGGHSYYLMAVRPQYLEAERLFASVLAFGRGERAERLSPAGVPVPDPRRGSAW